MEDYKHTKIMTEIIDKLIEYTQGEVLTQIGLLESIKHFLQMRATRHAMKEILEDIK